MTEEKKPKRKYTRKPKVEPLAVYAVMVKVTRGRKAETIYAESTRVENGCLVVVSMDGPQPLVERTRYIPLGSAEIEVCQRIRPYFQPQTPQPMDDEIPRLVAQHMAAQGQIPWTSVEAAAAARNAGPRIAPGPLEIARQRAAMSPVTIRPPQSSQMVERNADGIPVVTAGFLDGSPT